MKKLLFLITTVTFFSCDNDLDDVVNDYKNKPKSQELIGFWQLEGVYPAISSNQNNDIGISQGRVGIGLKEIMYLDTDYLRFLNKSSDSDSLYACNAKDKFHWYNQDLFIKSVHEEGSNTKNYHNISEYQIPYKFGLTKDTLIVQDNGKILYLLKRSDIKFTEYVFD